MLTPVTTTSKMPDSATELAIENVYIPFSTSAKSVTAVVALGTPSTINFASNAPDINPVIGRPVGSFTAIVTSVLLPTATKPGDTSTVVLIALTDVNSIARVLPFVRPETETNFMITPAG